jgi:hypothetical protein
MRRYGGLPACRRAVVLDGVVGNSFPVDKVLQSVGDRHLEPPLLEFATHVETSAIILLLSFPVPTKMGQLSIVSRQTAADRK